MTKPKVLTVLLLLLGAGLSASRPVGQPSPFAIEVRNIEQNRGNVVVEIYNDKSGWLKKPFRRLTLAPGAAVQTATFAVPPDALAAPVMRTCRLDGFILSGLRAVLVPRPGASNGSDPDRSRGLRPLANRCPIPAFFPYSDDSYAHYPDR